MTRPEGKPQREGGSTDSRIGTIDRREAIRRIAVLFGGSLSAPTLAGLLAGCEVPVGGGYQLRTLSTAEYRRVATIADLIIPETDTPGASAAGVPDFVDVMLTDYYEVDARERFLRQLANVDDVATSVVGRSFDRASMEEKRMIIDAMDEAAFPDPDERPEAAASVRSAVAEGEAPFMRTMKELTVSGYYTSEIGQTVELRLMPWGDLEGDIPYEEVGRSWA